MMIQMMEEGQALAVGPALVVDGAAVAKGQTLQMI